MSSLAFLSTRWKLYDDFHLTFWTPSWLKICIDSIRVFIVVDNNLAFVICKWSTKVDDIMSGVNVLSTQLHLVALSMPFYTRSGRLLRITKCGMYCTSSVKKLVTTHLLYPVRFCFINPIRKKQNENNHNFLNTGCKQSVGPHLLLSTYSCPTEIDNISCWEAMQQSLFSSAFDNRNYSSTLFESNPPTAATNRWLWTKNKQIYKNRLEIK